MIDPISGDTQAVWVSDSGTLAAYDDNLISTSTPPTGVTVVTSTAGDTTACWLDSQVQAAISNATLVQYAQIIATSPDSDSRGVRRDWKLYAEIIDSIAGISESSISLAVNGQIVTPSIAPIDDGFRIEFQPQSLSGYREQVKITLSAIDMDGFVLSRSWTFSTAATPAPMVSATPPPNVVCVRDIGLTSSEADDAINSIFVIWMEDIAGPLYITEDQSREVGRIAIDEQTYHKHIRSVQVLGKDASDISLADLQQGAVISLSCPAIGMVSRKCEVLSVQQQIDSGGQEDMVYNLTVAYYEAV